MTIRNILLMLLLTAGSAVGFTQSVSAQPLPRSKPVEATSATSAPRAGAIVKNQMGMEFAYVPTGSFMMGSTDADAQAAYNEESDDVEGRIFDIKFTSYNTEKPRHEVTFREGFYMGRYEVTQAQYQKVMGKNPSIHKNCDQCPVEFVSWEDAQEFIRRLNAQVDGYTYRLPSEAEWEYACRAGTTTAFAFGDSLSSVQANFDGNFPFGGAAKGVYRKKTTPVGSFQPNAWGLYDMHGNVEEWCQDWDHDSYNGAPTDGSVWKGGLGEKRELRMTRGGTGTSYSGAIRSANRRSSVPLNLDQWIGFRVVAEARR